MKKLIVVGFVGAAIIAGVMVAKGSTVAPTPEAKACMRMESLCSTGGEPPKDFETCVDEMKTARKVAGDQAFERSSRCLEEAQSCAGAAGCWAGGVGVGALGEMMKGFGTALSK